MQTCFHFYDIDHVCLECIVNGKSTYLTAHGSETTTNWGKNFFFLLFCIEYNLWVADLYGEKRLSVMLLKVCRLKSFLLKQRKRDRQKKLAKRPFHKSPTVAVAFEVEVYM